jgi:hypothetical protein
MKLGFQPVNLAAQFYGNAVYPNGTPPWACVCRLPSSKSRRQRRREMISEPEFPPGGSDRRGSSYGVLSKSNRQRSIK